MIKDRNLEHPAITRAQKTGYQDSPETELCDYCGGKIEVAYLYHGKCLCEGCVEKNIRDEIDEMTLEELVDLFEVESYESL